MLNPLKTGVTGQLSGVQNGSSLSGADGNVSHRISPRMQARSPKHGYSPIGELRLHLTRDLLVNRKLPPHLDAVVRFGKTSIRIANGHPVFCQQSVQPGVVIVQKLPIGPQDSQQFRKPPGLPLAIVQGKPDGMTDCFYAERKFLLH
jgi:hypothetical protein